MCGWKGAPEGPMPIPGPLLPTAGLLCLVCLEGQCHVALLSAWPEGAGLPQRDRLSTGYE